MYVDQRVLNRVTGAEGVIVAIDDYDTVTVEWDDGEAWDIGSDIYDKYVSNPTPDLVDKYARAIVDEWDRRYAENIEEWEWSDALRELTVIIAHELRAVTP